MKICWSAVEEVGITSSHPRDDPLGPLTVGPLPELPRRPGLGQRGFDHRIVVAWHPQIRLVDKRERHIAKLPPHALRGIENRSPVGVDAHQLGQEEIDPGDRIQTRLTG